MNIKNLLTLTVRIVDFNLVARQPELLDELRKLTLSPYSGLNHELTRMLKDAKEREVKCQVLLAYRFRKLVGWAILSKETTQFSFSRSYEGFKAENGVMFQVFVDPSHRREGIASEIYKKAQQLTNNELLHVCPWDEKSTNFYTRTSKVQTKLL